MTIEVIIVFSLIIFTILLFASEKFSIDVVAIIILCTLLLSGILNPDEAFSGFSNPATLTIAAMFVLSEGIRKTGLLNIIGDYFTNLGKQNFWLSVFIMMIVIGTLSAFINNTAVVAIFIPIILKISSDLNVSPSKLLMPLSFASMLGGVCTLLGTSTNILVSSIAKARGLAPFSMFEFTPMGIILLSVGFLYLFAIGIRIIPVRRTEQKLTTQFEMNKYLTDVVVEKNFDQIGRPLDKTILIKNLDLDVVHIFKKSGRSLAQASKRALEEGDIIRIRGSAREINKLIRREDLSLKPPKKWYDKDLKLRKSTIVEGVIAPDSALESMKVGDINFLDRYGAIVLAIRHHGELRLEEISEIQLSGGDSILLSIERNRIPELQADKSFVVVSRIPLEEYRESKIPVALSILAGVVLTAALGFVPIVISALTGVLLFILTGCISTDEAYNAIKWKIIIFLSGVLTLGLALDKTGASSLLSNFIVDNLGRYGHTAVLSGFFFLAMCLANIISNQATAALLAPIVIQLSQTLSVNPRPFLMAITFAASLSFMTPIGYQTNTLIYGPGHYKFTDFTKVGTPMNIILWLLGTFLIPVFWPF